MPRLTSCPVLLKTTVCLALFCHATFAQQVLDGDFDSNLDGWQVNATPAPTWSANDHDGDALSGSAALTNDADAAGTRLYPLQQCIVVPPGTYILQAWGDLPAAQPSGRLVLSYIGRANADCSGAGANQAGGYFLDFVGGWRRYSATITIPQSASYSLEILLGIEKDPAGGVLAGSFDAIHLLSDPIFADGFDGM